jgi:uncharacterized membrane protein YcaP (DUF421 family)
MLLKAYLESFYKFPPPYPHQPTLWHDMQSIQRAYIEHNGPLTLHDLGDRASQSHNLVIGMLYSAITLQNSHKVFHRNLNKNEDNEWATNI